MNYQNINSRNYIQKYIPSDAELFLVKFPGEIFLPSKPKKGHQITIKTTSRSAVKTVVISRRHLIDSENKYVIKEPYESLTVKFFKGQWWII